MEIKESKPNDLIYSSMSDSRDGGCHVKGGVRWIGSGIGLLQNRLQERKEERGR